MIYKKDSVPYDLKTKSTWRNYCGLKVEPEAEPAGQIWTEHGLASLYRKSDTLPIKENRQTKATREFYDIFVKGTPKKYICEIKGDWKSFPLKGFPGKKLNIDQVKEHICGDAIYGVHGGKKWTRWIAIDVDLHEGDPEIFLEQVKILLEKLSSDRWHYQVRNGAARGIHFLYVFEKAVKAEDCVQKLRELLVSFDKEHEQLALRAKAAGMNDFSSMEIFPKPQRGFRLPLCAGRSMLLDKPLGLTVSRHKMVQDVAGYMKWLKNPRKMDGAKVLEYLKQEIEHKAPSPQSKPKRESFFDFFNKQDKTGKISLRNTTRKTLVEFWQGKNCPVDSLNAMINLTAVFMPFYYEKQKDAAEFIWKMIKELPDKTFSDRLKGEDYGKVDRVINRDLDMVYDDYKCFPDPKMAKIKLMTTFNVWEKKKFSLIDKSTWDKPLWNKEKEAAEMASKIGSNEMLIKKLMEVLKTSREKAIAATVELLIYIKIHKRPGIEVIKKMLIKHGIKAKHHGKASRYVKCLRENEVIEITGQYVKGSLCRRYAVVL